MLHTQLMHESGGYLYTSEHNTDNDYGPDWSWESKERIEKYLKNGKKYYGRGLIQVKKTSFLALLYC